jgi:hypothetical protein
LWASRRARGANIHYSFGGFALTASYVLLQRAENGEAKMPTLVTQHPVKNYDVWRPHFDKHKNNHAEVDIASPRVYGNTDDPNDLLLLFDVADEVRAKEFGQSLDLRSIMEAAGVEMSACSVKLLPD